MHYLKVYNLFHSEYLVLTINISKACTFFFFFWSLTENFSTTFVRKTPKSTFFFFFFLSLTGFFFPKKLVRQVIKLEWPYFTLLVILCIGMQSMYVLYWVLLHKIVPVLVLYWVLALAYVHVAVL